MKENRATVLSATDGTAVSSILTSFLDGSRRLAEREELVDIAAFMLYATYVSHNADAFDIDLDQRFHVDSVPQYMGNDYVARQFIDTYSELGSFYFDLPHVELNLRERCDWHNIIDCWVGIINRSGISFEETESFDVARTITHSLEEVFSANGGKATGDHSSYAPLAELIIRLANVDGKSVYDLACGYGTFLAEAAFAGARSLRGSDLSHEAILRAKLLAFFSSPLRGASLRIEDSLLVHTDDLFDRVVCAPPLGMRMDRSKLDKYAWAAAPLEDGTIPSGPYCEDYIIAKALSSLEVGGIAVIQVSPSFLFHQQRARSIFRNSLVSRGHISAVIQLPGGCVAGTSINSAILILSKESSEDDILLVDASSEAIKDKGYFNQSRRKCIPTEAGIGWLSEIVQRRREIPCVSTLVPRGQIVETGADLCYATYGDVYASVMPSRSTADVVVDFEEARSRINILDTRIEQILAAL